jgi:hypothetical protein
MLICSEKDVFSDYRCRQPVPNIHVCRILFAQETWYVPPNKKSKIAGGKLPERLRNTWRQIKICIPSGIECTEPAHDELSDGRVRVLN